MSEEDNSQNQEKSEENEESQSNQDEQESQEEKVKEEKEEKEEIEEPQENKEEVQETREEPEREEHDGDETSIHEEGDNEGEVPTEVIIFSNLSKEEKIKYFNFFIANDTIFNREPEGTWIAEIDIFEDDKADQDLMLSNKTEDLKKMRQSKFRTTKKDYDAMYGKLIKVINPSPGIKGTKMNLNAIKYMIQEIYSLKFLKDTQALFNKEETEPEPFPVFVGNFLINKFPKKDVLHKKAIDFMLSLDFYGLKHKDIKVFQQFVTEEYDADDLIFYLFVRSCIEKELKVFFLEKAKENLGQGLLYGQGNDDILVPVKKCQKLAKAIFGNDEEELMNNFMENIKKLLETDAADEKKKHLKANSILNMSLANYHDSRGKVDEEDEDKEKEGSDDEKKKKKKDKDKEKKKKDKEKKKHKKKKEEEDSKKKHKHKHKKEESDSEKEDKENSEEQKEEEEEKEEKEEEIEEKEKDNIEQEEEEKIEKITPSKKEPTRLRGQKKSNLKTSSAPSNAKTHVPNSGLKSKSSAPESSTKKSSSKTSKVTTTIKVPASKTTISKKPNPNTNKINVAKPAQNRINTTGNTGTSKPLTNRPPRKISQESRGNTNKESKTKIEKKTQGSSSVGKRKVNTSVGKRSGPSGGHGGEKPAEQTLEFKKILNKNRIEKAVNENEKATCLLYIISDYFKVKEIDGYFKNIVENNPIFKNYSAKIYANIKNTKEFTLKKLNGICKYIAAGDKNGFVNFMKLKDKGGKISFDSMKSSFNSLLKSGPLKNLNENDVGEFCKMILEIPELSVQTSKSFLKYCE